MIQLNLVPPKVRAVELLRKILIGAVVVYALAVAWLGWRWTLDHAKLVAERKEVQKVQNELNAPELQFAVKAVQKFADDLAAVKAKASVVNEFRKEQTPLLRLLDSAPDWTMNGQVWFTSLNVQAGHGQHAVILAGATLSRAFFVKYFDFMGSQPMVESLSLNAPPADVYLRNIQAVQFQLGFSVGDQP